MDSGKHLTPKSLEHWATLPFPSQMQYVHHVSVACSDCWSVIYDSEPSQPRGHDDPFLRAVARILQQPKVDLSLPSLALRPLMSNPFRPDDFAALLLEESIALGLESPSPYRVASYLSLPSALAELLRESPATETAGVDLRVNVGCAAVRFYLLAGDVTKAEDTLTKAKEHHDPDRCYTSTTVNLMLAEFKVACERDRTEAVRLYSKMTQEGFPLLVADPVLRFEISRQLANGLHRLGRDSADNPDDANWALSQLEIGHVSHDIVRLNGIYHKARFAIAAGSLLPDLPSTAATELEADLEGVDRWGDYYTLGLFYQLLGELRQDAPVLENALKTYAILKLEADFLETWRLIEKLDPLSRSRVSDRAYKAFGAESSHRMARIVADSGKAQTEGVPA